MYNNWITDKQFGFYCGGAAAVERYNAKITERRKKYKHLNNLGPKDFELLVQEVNNSGFAKIKNFFNKDELDPLREEFLKLLESEENVKQVQQGSFLQLDQPFLNSKNVLKLALNKSIVDIATSYYKCIPALGTCNLRHSNPNFTKNNGTNKFHRDFNSPVKFLKFFIYLNNVSESEGPFTYVKGSNKRMPSNWSSRHRWEDKQITDMYGKESIVKCTGNYGDLIVATTVGFHKGSIPVSGPRNMLTINYVITPELKNQSIDEESAWFLMNKKQKLKNWQKPLVDFLKKV